MKVFLSYARADAQLTVDELRTRLGEARRFAWVDRHDIPTGTDWRAEIHKAILSVDAFVLLVSAASVRSSHVLEELEFALKLQKSVLPLLVAQVPSSDLPAPLAARQLLNFTGNIADKIPQLIADLEQPWTRVKLQLDSLLRGDELPGARLPSELEPLARKLQRVALIHDASAGNVRPPEVFVAFIDLLRRFTIDRGSRSFSELRQDLESSLYPQDWDMREAYLAHQRFFSQLLDEFVPLVQGEPIPIVLLAMTAPEALELESGAVFNDRSDEVKTHFARLRADLEQTHGVTDWARRYQDLPDNWQPFSAAPNSETIADIVRLQLQTLGTVPKPLVPKFFDIRTLNTRPLRQQLLSLRYGGCVVIMDMISITHPAIHDAYRRSLLDSQERTVMIQLAPYSWPEFGELTLNVKARLDLEFSNRFGVDQDDSWRQAVQRVEFERFIKNVMPTVLPEAKRPKRGIDTYILGR
jgi:hypothetical protein